MPVFAKSIRFDEDRFWLELEDGRVLGAPLAWFPRLLSASPEQLQDCELSKRGVHWEELDEDISVEGLLKGLGAFAHEGTAA